MIKAKGERDGRPIVVFGLSYQNLNRLRQDQPILVNGDELDLPHDVLIFAGPTEQWLADQIIPKLTGDAKVHISDRLKT